jgi:hypothetical protein
MTIVRLTPVVALLAALATPPSPPTWSKSTVTNILTFYGAGDYAGAIEAIESVAELPVASPLPDLAAGPDSAFEDWRRGANDWIRLAVWPSGTRRARWSPPLSLSRSCTPVRS